MITEELLGLLQGVRRTSRGWSARCPAHHDNSPSLSIREAEDQRVLIYCFSGCTTNEICTALRLTLRDLFPDTGEPERPLQQERRRRQIVQVIKERKWDARGGEIDVRREAERLISSAKGIDISAWSHAKLDEELNRLADAHAILRREGVVYEPW